MSKHRKMQALFNAWHNWSAQDEEQIELSAEQILETLAWTEERKRLASKTPVSEDEYVGWRILKAASAHLRGERVFYRSTVADYLAEREYEPSYA